MLTKEQVQLRKEIDIQSERVDDIPLLIGMMKRMGLPQVLDKYIPPPLEAAGSELGMDHHDLAHLYFVGGRSSESRGQEVCQEFAADLVSGDGADGQ